MGFVILNEATVEAMICQLEELGAKIKPSQDRPGESTRARDIADSVKQSLSSLAKVSSFGSMQFSGETISEVKQTSPLEFGEYELFAFAKPVHKLSIH